MNENLEEIVPKKKKSFFKNKFFVYSMLALIIVGTAIGSSYAYFNYSTELNEGGVIKAGQMYAKLKDDEVTLNLNKMYPRTSIEAREGNNQSHKYVSDEL